jgi:hypothetical protein
MFEVPPMACPDPTMFTDSRKLPVCMRFSATKKLARTILFILPDFSLACAATLVYRRSMSLQPEPEGYQKISLLANYFTAA